MKKGYLFIVVFALFQAVAQTWYYRAYVAKDAGETPLNKWILQGVSLFLLLVIPGWLLVRWYYRQKNR